MLGSTVGQTADAVAQTLAPPLHHIMDHHGQDDKLAQLQTRASPAAWNNLPRVNLVRGRAWQGPSTPEECAGQLRSSG